MSLIFITGISGSGKSTVSNELKRRGYESYSSDEDGFNWWYDRKTNEPVSFNPSNEEKHAPEWIKKFAWKISKEKVEKLKEEAENKTIFLTGSVENEKEVWDLFSKVICLVINDETLRKRIDQRSSNLFGKAPHELEIILEYNKKSEANYRQFGAIIIDATQPLEKVVDQILQSI